jgi:hypothetical protein
LNNIFHFHFRWLIPQILALIAEMIKLFLHWSSIYMMHSYYDRYTNLLTWFRFWKFHVSRTRFWSMWSASVKPYSMLRLSVLRRNLVGEGSTLLLQIHCWWRFYDDIHLDVDPNTLLLQPTDISIEFPLHARYQVKACYNSCLLLGTLVLPHSLFSTLLLQSLNESGYSILEFGAPDMVLSCNTKEKVENSNCLFKLKNNEANMIGEYHLEKRLILNLSLLLHFL